MFMFHFHVFWFWTESQSTDFYRGSFQMKPQGRDRQDNMALTLTILFFGMITESDDNNRPCL